VTGWGLLLCVASAGVVGGEWGGVWRVSLVRVRGRSGGGGWVQVFLAVSSGLLGRRPFFFRVSEQ